MSGFDDFDLDQLILVQILSLMAMSYCYSILGMDYITIYQSLLDSELSNIDKHSEYINWMIKCSFILRIHTKNVKNLPLLLQ